MSEDDLLRKLGQVAREQAAGEPRALDDRWDRLAAGALSVDEEAELRRLAETSDDARDAWEAFRPLGADFQAGVVAAITAQTAGERSAPSAGSAAQVPAATTSVPAGKVLPFHRNVRRLAAWGAALGAAAAAMAGLLVRVPPLPAYAVAELSGGSRMTRGEVMETPTLHPGDRFQASLRPETAVKRARSLRAEAFLLRGTELRPLDVQTELDTSGALRVTGTLEADFTPGPWTLWLVVGRRGSLPDPERLRSLTATAHERNWVAVAVPLTIGSGAKE